jgi:DNA-binding MarR family transcriptional regulator
VAGSKPTGGGNRRKTGHEAAGSGCGDGHVVLRIPVRAGGEALWARCARFVAVAREATLPSGPSGVSSQTGCTDLRISHGFVVQHVVEGPVRIGELAERMGVTQQAASKAVAELEALGYLERSGDPDDGRVRRVGLSARGAAAVATARAVRAEIERELAAALGADRVEAARGTALAALEWAGGAEAVRTRRVPAPR